MVSTVLVRYYLLGGDTAAPSRLFARLCHVTYLVSNSWWSVVYCKRTCRTCMGKKFGKRFVCSWEFAKWKKSGQRLSSKRCAKAMASTQLQLLCAVQQYSVVLYHCSNLFRFFHTLFFIQLSCSRVIGDKTEHHIAWNVNAIICGCCLLSARRYVGAVCLYAVVCPSLLPNRPPMSVCHKSVFCWNGRHWSSKI